MKTMFLLSGLFTFASCTAPMPHTPSQTLSIFSALAKPTLATFSGLPDNITFPELVRRAGEPDKDIGSGVYIFIYYLADGSEVSVGTTDKQKISGIFHIVGCARTRLYPAAK